MDRQRGRFRTWLRQVCQSALVDWAGRRRRKARAEGAWLNRLSELPNSSESDSVLEWERLHRRRVLSFALERVRARSRPTSWACFQRHLLRPGLRALLPTDRPGAVRWGHTRRPMASRHLLMTRLYQNLLGHRRGLFEADTQGRGAARGQGVAAEPDAGRGGQRAGRPRPRRRSPVGNGQWRSTTRSAAIVQVGRRATLRPPLLPGRVHPHRRLRLREIAG